MNPYERSSDLQALLRVQLPTSWNCTRYRRFKLSSGLPNISDQHLLKTKHYGVHNTSRMSLLGLLQYKRLPSSKSLESLQTFATINLRMVSKQVSV